MPLLQDKVVVVTGAGRGIGRGHALELSRQGAAVVVNELDADTGQAVVDEIRSAGGHAVPDQGDCSEVEAAEAMIRRALDEFGRLDALVNNAGILRDRTLVNMTAAEWDAVIRVHLRGHYAPTHAACAHWKTNGGPGRIVCTASTSGILGNFGQSNYGAAKAGIAAFSTIVALEMAKYDVTCNAIAPAARTRMTESAYGDLAGGTGSNGTGSNGAGSNGAASNGAGDFDFWHPDNVAPFVAFLCSDSAAHISGKVFGVQGDAVEIYQPYTSVAAIENGGARWDPAVFADRVQELFEASGIDPAVSNPMRRLRYSMTERR